MVRNPLWTTKHYLLSIRYQYAKPELSNNILDIITPVITLDASILKLIKLKTQIKLKLKFGGELQTILGGGMKSIQHLRL